MTMKPLFLLSFLMSVVLLHAQSVEHGLVGFATYPSAGIEGTIGGGLGEIVKVDNEADLRKYCKASGAYTILFEGTITNTAEQDIQVTSNKTIIGLNGNAELEGIGFKANGVNNVIIRGFRISNAHVDAIAFRNSTHVWIDHCDLSSSSDGLFDFTNGSDFMTASWNAFHDHDKVSICNSGTQHYDDVDKQNVSYHHNSFINTTQRNPRIGYGRGHVWNNYYENVSSYCVGYFTGARVIVENNYFKKCNKPLNQSYSNDPTSAHYGKAESIGNIFDGCSGNTKGTGEAFDAEYFYDASRYIDAASDVPNLVNASAGVMSGLEYDLVPLPNSGRIDYPVAEPTLKWSKAPDALSYRVYFAASLDALDTCFVAETQKNSIEVGLLTANTKYFWRVDIQLADTLLKGAVWSFTTAIEQAAKPYPANGETNAQLQAQKNANTTQPMTLTWSPAFGAESYRLSLRDELSEMSHVVELDGKTTSWQAPELIRGKTYTWSVESLIDGQAVATPEEWTFSASIVEAVEGKNEAENWTRGLRAYIEPQDGSWFTASGKKVIGGESGPGTLNAEWRGKHVEAEISIQMFDESDGSGTYKLFLNNKQIGKATANKNNDKLATYVLATTELKEGDQLRLELAPEGGEGCRTDYIYIKIKQVIDGIENVIVETNENAASYNLWGIPVDEDYHGIIIKNREKIFNK